jgi:uncharacterized membrane protein YdjX (TVP38/TMEM64 family)
MTKGSCGMTSTTPNSWLRRAPLVIIILFAVLGAVLFRDVLTFEVLRDNRDMLIAYRDQHYLLSVLIFIAIYIVLVAFSLPGATLATLTGGFLFATFPGVLLNLTGATLGAIGIFLATKAGLGDRLAARMETSEGAIKRFKDNIDDNQWSALFLIRLVPAVPFFVANVLPALFDVPLSRFAVSTFFGIIPGTLILTSVGAGLGDVFDSGETPDLSFVFSPPVLLPILGLCLLAALPIIIKVYRARTASGTTPPPKAQLKD